MRKSPSHSSGNSRPDASNKFKKEGSAKPYGKDAKPFKKNYDGRASEPGEKPTRSSKPYSGRATDSDKPKRSFGKPSFGSDSRPPRDEREGGFKKPFPKRDGASDRPKRSFDKPSFGSDSRPPREERAGGFKKPFPKRDGDSERPKRSFDKPSFDGDKRAPREERAGGFKKPFAKRDGDSERPKRAFDKPFSKDARPRKDDDRKPRKEVKDPNKFSERSKRLFDREPFDNGLGESKPGGDAAKKTGDTRPFRQRQDDKPTFSKEIGDGETDNSKYSKPFEGKNRRADKIAAPTESFGKKKHFHDHSDPDRRKKKRDDDDDDDDDDKEINQKEGPRLEMPLNKYIAHSGECSRRDAAELVRQGKVKVNGELVLDPGYRVLHDDKVTMSGKKLTPQKGMVYILLNKPKGFITTNDDPQGRKTVMELVGNAGVDRLFPVGRLDRDTSGLLLITNDGDLTQKLCHPSFAIKKVYHVTLDKPLTKADFEKVVAGVELEDGQAIVDEIAYLESKNELGLEIHSGRNRIVRRIFESLGYVVEKLDRVMYAGLTKKNLPRSKWRYLDEREVVLLKHFKV